MTLFQTQRVSKYWRGVTATSPDLQEALFFRAPPRGRTLETWELLNSKMERVEPIPEIRWPSFMVTDTTPFHVRHVTHTPADAEKDRPELLLPVLLNPLMERCGGLDSSRQPMVQHEDEADDGKIFSRVYADIREEHVSYEGTRALLEQCAAMYLTNPPTHEASLHVKVWYSDADTFTSAPIRAEFIIPIESKTGLRVQDVLEGMHRGKLTRYRLCEDIYHVWSGDEFYADQRGFLGDWETASTTLNGLKNIVRQLRGWRRAVRHCDVQLEIDLLASASPGLFPIVPTADERRLVIES